MSETGVTVNIEADVKDAIYVLKAIEGDSKKITKGILNGVGGYTRSAIKKEYRNHLGKRSGNLYKNIKKKMTRRGDTVYVASWAKSPNRALYGFVLANGADIKPKLTNESKVLTFQINGKWIRKHEIHIEPHDFIVGPGNRYLNSPKYKNDLEKLKQKQIERVFKKKGIKING